MNRFIFALALLHMVTMHGFAQVSVTNDGNPPDPSAMMEVKSTNRGVLIPRMSTAQIIGIPSPANGLMVFNTSDDKLYIYVAVAGVWKEVSFGSGIISPFVCGNPFTDTRDNKTYNTVLIGTQCWMAQNLNVGTRIDGTVVQSNNGTIEKYCYQNIESNCDVYGGLYVWNEWMNYTSSSNSNPSGRQGICPSGWHAPSDAEWCQLEQYLDNSISCTTTAYRGTVAGGMMKESGTAHWMNPNTAASNSSGFTALPGGYSDLDGTYGSLTMYGYFYTSTESSTSNAWYRGLYYGSIQIGRYSDNKLYGYSARCIKN